MIKPMFILAAAMLAAPVMAQDVPAAAPAAEAAPPAAAEAPAAPAAAMLPPCSAKVQDSCQQTGKQEARAMSGAQADARDAKTGSWTPNAGGSDKDAMAAPAAMKSHHKAHHKSHTMMTTTTKTTTEAPAPK